MKKLKIVMILLITLLIVLGGSVFAANASITMQGESSVQPSTTNKVIINLSSEKEIGVLSGIISTSANITNVKVSGMNDWSLTHNKTTGQFNIVKAEGSKSENIMEIEYTVSNQEGTATITLSNLKATTISYETQDLGTKSKEITIKNSTNENNKPSEEKPTEQKPSEDNKPTQETPTENVKPAVETPKEETKTTQSTTNQSSTKTTQENKVTVIKDNTQSKNKLPQTGDTVNLFVIAFAIVIIGAFAIYKLITLI